LVKIVLYNQREQLRARRGIAFGTSLPRRSGCDHIQRSWLASARTVVQPRRLHTTRDRFRDYGSGLFAALRDGLFPHGSARASNLMIKLLFVTAQPSSILNLTLAAQSAQSLTGSRFRFGSDTIPRAKDEQQEAQWSLNSVVSTAANNFLISW